MLSPSVSSPSKYFDGFIGETQAIIPLMVAWVWGVVISAGDSGGGGGVISISLDFFLGDGVVVSRLRLAMF